jgi:hypothetical protein
MVICKKCKKSFNLFINKKDLFENDGLCGKCRARKTYLLNIDKYRKTKICPNCKKPILKTSEFCYSCSQLGERNKNYIDGHSSSTRVCSECSNSISTGAFKGKCQDCYTKSLVGDKNPNYRFGHYSGNFSSTKEYKLWRQSVYKRDGFKCILCGKSHTLEAHHILPKRTNPELIYDVNNGITLCRVHHRKTFKKELELSEAFFNIIRPK